MTEVHIKDKQKYLNENYILDVPPKLTDMKLCIHCNDVITVGDYKVYRADDGMEFIYCPNAPFCNGTIIDWFDLGTSFD